MTRRTDGMTPTQQVQALQDTVDALAADLREREADLVEARAERDVAQAEARAAEAGTGVWESLALAKDEQLSDLREWLAETRKRVEALENPQRWVTGTGKAGVFPPSVWDGPLPGAPDNAPDDAQE